MALATATNAVDKGSKAPPAGPPKDGKDVKEVKAKGGKGGGDNGTPVDLTSTAIPVPQAHQLELKHIVLADNPGRMDGDNKLETLRHAVEKAGQIVNPVTIRPTTPEDDGDMHADGKYAIVDGRRRFRVAKSLGFKTIPVVLWNPGKGKERITPVQGAILSNLANRTLTAPEMLSAFLALAHDQDWDIKVPKAAEKGIGTCGTDVPKLAKFVDMSPANIYRTLRMGILPADVLKKVHNKVVSAEAARDMGGLVANGLLNEEQATLVFAEALDMSRKRAMIDNRRDPNAPDTRTPDQIRNDKELRKRKKAKKLAAAGANGNGDSGDGGDGGEDDGDDGDNVETTTVGKADVKKAAEKLASEGKLSKGAAKAVAEASGKGAGISADAKSMSNTLKHIDEVLETLLESENPHIARLAAAIGKFRAGELMAAELVKQFEKHCAGADE